jgi:hypothetical protein
MISVIFKSLRLSFISFPSSVNQPLVHFLDNPDEISRLTEFKIENRYYSTRSGKQCRVDSDLRSRFCRYEGDEDSCGFCALGEGVEFGSNIGEIPGDHLE